MPSTNRKIPEALTPNEQAVYLEVMKKKICSLEDINEVTGNYQTSRAVMSRLSGKGYVMRVHRGYYAGVPPESVGMNYEVDRYILAHKVGNHGGALAYHTALELHGVAHSYFNTVYCLRPKSLRGFDFQGIEYRYIETKKLFGVFHLMREGIRIPVTDRERTFLDCIRRPDYCGGLEEVLKSLSTFHTIDVKAIDGYLGEFHEQSLMQKTGFVLTILKDELKVSEDYLDELRNRVREKIYYLAPRPKTGAGRLIGEWNLIVPRNLSEVTHYA
jgi:predicted transcriptional regulator of viral defense system